VSKTTFAVLIALAVSMPALAQEPPPPWDSVPTVQLEGLRLYWDVGTGDKPYNNTEAVKHGFTLIDQWSPFRDVAGKGAETVAPTDRSPWIKPSYFQRTILQNARTTRSLAVLDIEENFEMDPVKARAENQPGAPDIANSTEWSDRYYSEMASWYTEPLRLLKQRNPLTRVGIYGLQPFARTYWDIPKGGALLDEINRPYERLWRYVDPFVDCYIVSIYTFYDKPETTLYWAANVEENYRRTRQYGEKPVVPYLWLRYHDSNKELGSKEIADYLAEGYPIIPFFCGAKGIVLWGWERQAKTQPYHDLPIFMKSLARLAPFSDDIAAARPEPDEPAWQLWQEKKPLVRRLHIKPDEWLVAIMNPWQAADATGRVRVTCGNVTADLEVEGHHTEVYHLAAGRWERLKCW
jgi:hypothetical protein